MSLEIASRTDMPAHRLIGPVKTGKGIQVQIRWRGLPKSEVTLEPVNRVLEDVPQLFRKLLGHKNVSRDWLPRCFGRSPFEKERVTNNALRCIHFYKLQSIVKVKYFRSYHFN